MGKVGGVMVSVVGKWEAGKGRLKPQMQADGKASQSRVNRYQSPAKKKVVSGPPNPGEERLW